MRARLLTAAAAAATLALVATGCSASPEAEPAAFPAQDITLVVPYAAGGASDLSARALATEMEEVLGVSIIVENRTGGAGAVGLSFLAGAAPDGYTIGYMPVETTMLGFQGYVIQPTDYELLGQIVSVPATIAVPADSPYETLDDLIAAAEAAPGTITVSNSGAGSIWNATTTALGEAAGVEFRPIPFDGGAPAVTAAVAGDVDAVVAGISETSVPAADGSLRVLAVFADATSDALPGVQTAQDLGYDVVIGGWGAIGTPTGLPDDVRAALEEAVATAAQSSSFIEVISNSGNIPVYVDATTFSEFFETEVARFERIFGGS